MIKAIVFDFDGVLVESAGIKTRAVRELFSEWPHAVEEMVEYHLANMGVSRYEKFRHFYENVLGEEYTEEAGLELGRRFSKLVYHEVLRAPLVDGSAEMLRDNHCEYLMFIASGTPHEELNDIVAARGLHAYFRGVFGSPKKKAEILRSIIAGHGLFGNEVVFVGDATTDMRAAKQAGTYFIARVSGAESALLYERHRVRDMTGLVDAVRALDAQWPYKEAVWKRR